MELRRFFGLKPVQLKHLTHHYAQAIQPLLAEGASPVVICSGTIRSGLRKFFAAKFPELAFLSYEELPPKVEIVPVATVPSLS